MSGFIELTPEQLAAVWVAPDAPRLCYGAQTADNQADCDGPDVKRVRVFSPECTVPFVTDYCVECRQLAVEAGCTLEILS